VVGAEIHTAPGKVVAPHADHARRAPVAVTDARGEYACRSLPPGLITLGASALGRADGVLPTVELRSDSANVVDFTLAPERDLRLRVTSEGRGLPGARLEPLGESYDLNPWKGQRQYLAFWRGPTVADDQGWLNVHGVDASFQGDMRVHAHGFQAQLVSLATSPDELALAPVTWLEVAATSREGGPPPELYRVAVRDTTREPSWCGNCDENRFANLWRDSPAVELLAPNHWRIAWNGLGCFVE